MKDDGPGHGLLPLADFVAALRSELRLASEHGQEQEPRFSG
jgi:hypothetical protein